MPASQVLQQMFTTRAAIIQWREKDLSSRENRKYVQQGIELAREFKKIFIVNSDTFLAIAEGADGVHLTSSQKLKPALEARENQVDSHFIIGQSVHSREEAIKAEDQGADYVLISPVFEPISKKSFFPAFGLKELETVCRQLSVPVFALGGISDENYRSVLEAGASGIAGISWVLSQIESDRQNR
jgi:thiamine-phosphate pyrophosphorylase